MRRRRIGLLEFLFALFASALIVVAGLGTLVKGAQVRQTAHVQARLEAEAMQAATLTADAIARGAVREQSADIGKRTWTRPMTPRERELFACDDVRIATMSLRQSFHTHDLRRQYMCDRGAQVVTGYKPVASHITDIAIDGAGNVRVTATDDTTPTIQVIVERAAPASASTAPSPGQEEK